MSSYLRALRLVNFRNYADATALLAPGLNIVVGDNAQGKTNLLEAISFNVTGSSPRTPNENEVVRWGTDFTRTEIPHSPGRLHRTSARPPSATRPARRKRITVDGAPVSSLTDYAAGGAGARVVTFFPDDIRVVKGAPSDRREFLDALLSSLRPAYARAAAEYAKAVAAAQPAAAAHPGRVLLREDARDVGQEGRLTLEKRSSKAVRRRLPLPRDTSETLVSALYGPEKAAIHYRIARPLEGYAEALREAHSADIERGTTSVGPHRDDFEVLLGGVNMTTYGSQGQQRLATLALEVRGQGVPAAPRLVEDPILLFDDVMSELDERRRRDT